MADPGIKLFGKTIPLPDVISGHLSSPPRNDVITPAEGAVSQDRAVSEDTAPLEIDTDDDNNNNNNIKDDQDGNICTVKQSEVTPDSNACQDAPSGTTANPDALSGADENAAEAPSKSEEEKNKASVSRDKVLKKPDKILPCPRCNSMDTKFCYYNNYNVNQPRHFCKNCQRYWTAGGSMRNVPVGAGRRKNKSSSSHFRHVSIPEALHSVRPDIANGVHPGLQANGTILTFGSDTPLCESMASILNIAEKTMRNCTPNGFQQADELKIPVPVVAMETGGSQLDRSHSKDDANKSGQEETTSPNRLPFSPQFPCYPGAPWPYPWNSTQWSPPLAAPPFCPNGIALPYYPAPAYWGCTVPGTWSVPLIRQPSPQGQSSPSSGPNSPTLGKHTRDGNVLTWTNSELKEPEDNNSEPSLWIPKTLRIDDPGEAARSSIWTTLGIKNSDKPDSIGRGSGLFKAFQSQCDDNSPKVETSLVLEANPAALSRSQNFQENS